MYKNSCEKQSWFCLSRYSVFSGWNVLPLIQMKYTSSVTCMSELNELSGISLWFEHVSIHCFKQFLILRGSKWIWKNNQTIQNLGIVFHFCMKYFADKTSKSLEDKDKSVFPLTCFARFLQQRTLVAACLSVFPLSVLSSVTDNHALLGSGGWLGHWRNFHLFTSRKS